MMSINLLYDAIDKMVAERGKLDKKLDLYEKQFSKLLSSQAVAQAKLTEAQAVVRNSLNSAQETERAALAA